MQNTPNGQPPANPDASTGGAAAGVAALVVLMLFFGFLLWILLSARPIHRDSVAVAQATEETPLPSPTKLTSLPTEIPPAGYSGEVVAQGHSYFGATCSGCHGSDAQGIAGLGKDLVNSEFVSSMDDDELHHFIITGRSAFDPANATGIDMPARGGNPALTDENIYQIIAYLRTQADPSLLVSSNPPSDAEVAEATEPVTAVTESPAVASPTFTPTATTDRTPQPTVVFVPREFDAVEAYNLSCAGCHGVDGEGVPANGPALLDSVLLSDPQALFDFLVNGNPDADVAGGEFSHPVRGSYPILTDEQLQQVIDYLRSLSGE
jgi:mono/diheme cytochrome c family protein